MTESSFQVRRSRPFTIEDLRSTLITALQICDEISQHDVAPHIDLALARLEAEHFGDQSRQTTALDRT